MDARCADMAEGARQEDVAHPVDGVEPGSEMDIAPPPTEPNVSQSKDEQPQLLPVEPVADAVGSHSRSFRLEIL